MAEFDAVVLATGYRPRSGRSWTCPACSTIRGYPRDWRGGGAQPNLFFVGYTQPATGLLRQIGIDAEAAAAAIAAAGALTRT